MVWTQVNENNRITCPLNQLLCQEIAYPRIFAEMKPFVFRRRIPWKYLLKDQTVNKFPSAFFTTKTGLLQSLQQLHWYSPQPVSSFFPRCYQVWL